MEEFFDSVEEFEVEDFEGDASFEDSVDSFEEEVEVIASSTPKLRFKVGGGSVSSPNSEKVEPSVAKGDASSSSAPALRFGGKRTSSSGASSESATDGSLAIPVISGSKSVVEGGNDGERAVTVGGLRFGKVKTSVVDAPGEEAFGVEEETEKVSGEGSVGVGRPSLRLGKLRPVGEGGGGATSVEGGVSSGGGLPAPRLSGVSKRFGELVEEDEGLPVVGASVSETAVENGLDGSLDSGDEGTDSEDFLSSFLSGGEEDSVSMGEVREEAPVEAVAPGGIRRREVRSEARVSERDRELRKVRGEKGAVVRGRKLRNRAKVRARRDGGTVKYRTSLNGIETGFGDRGALEYLVDGEGRFVVKVDDSDGFGKLVTLVEEGGMVDSSEVLEKLGDGGVLVNEELRGQVVFPWSGRVGPGVDAREGEKVVGEKKRLSRAEVEHFSSLVNVRTGGALGRDEVAALFRGSSVVEGSVGGSVRPWRLSEAERGRIMENPDDERGQKLLRSMTDSVGAVDIEVIRFICRFRYASVRHVAALCGVTVNTASVRLNKLKRLGLVTSFVLFGSGKLWLPTSAGMLLSGYNLQVVTEKNISHQLIPHQFTVNHVAANLMGGNLDVLEFGEVEGIFPQVNRTLASGKLTFGEELVSETEILSSFGRVREQRSSSVYREILRGVLDESFREWHDGGGVGAGLASPEFGYGNEWMWVLFPPAVLSKAYHIPDLVVKRARGEDGSPRSIAVEVETVDSKAKDKYLPILKSYFDDRRIYGRVVWVCKSLGAARAIEEAAKECGLFSEGRIDIVPIITESGIFVGRDLWRL